MYNNNLQNENKYQQGAIIFMTIHDKNHVASTRLILVQYSKKIMQCK